MSNRTPAARLIAEAANATKRVEITPDQLQDELLLIVHHVDDVKKGVDEGDKSYAKKGLADIQEAVARLAKFLPPEFASELRRIRD